MAKRNTNKSAPCSIFASKPTCRKWIWRRKCLEKSHDAENTTAQIAQFIEDEPAHLVRLPCCSRAGDALFCRATGVAWRTGEENFHPNGERKAAGKTERTAETARTAKGNSQ